MISAVDHIGIAVHDLEVSIKLFSAIFQLTDVHREEVAEQKVAIASFPVGEVLIELTAPTSADSPIAKFLEKRGEGIHHIAFKSDNVNAELQRLHDDGIKLINQTAQPGAHNTLIGFLHPKSTNGVLMEMCQPQDTAKNL